MQPPTPTPPPPPSKDEVHSEQNSADPARSPRLACPGVGLSVQFVFDVWGSRLRVFRAPSNVFQSRL